MLKYKLQDLAWHPRLMWVRRARCFFIGHDERMGNPLNYQDPYCDFCVVNWPMDKACLPDLLTRILNWAMDRSALVDKFFIWTSEQPWRVHLPRWWEY